jgi:hypothetical protein
MDDDEKTLKWQELLRLEKEARGSASELRKQGASPSEMRKPLQTWWLTASDVFHVYRGALSQGASPAPPPIELLAVMTELAAYIAAGQIPDSIAHASSQGRHRPGPDMARDMGFAVAYMLASRPGGIEHCGETIVIVDETPVKTVCEAFGIIRQTAYDWKQAVLPALGVNPLDGEMLTSLMREAGARYKEAGRSLSAVIRRRARK